MEELNTSVPVLFNYTTLCLLSSPSSSVNQYVLFEHMAGFDASVACFLFS